MQPEAMIVTTPAITQTACFEVVFIASKGETVTGGSLFEDPKTAKRGQAKEK